ncbi:hypothetical protein [Tunicatimonas sp.]
MNDQVVSGDFQDAGEVVRDAMRLHQIYSTKILEELLVEIAKG